MSIWSVTKKLKGNNTHTFSITTMCTNREKNGEKDTHKDKQTKEPNANAKTARKLQN